MAVTEADWLKDVKSWLQIGGAYNDAQLTLRILAVKDLLVMAGVTASRLETPSGVFLVAQGVNDTWNLAPGEMQFSRGFSETKETFKNASLADEVDI